MTDIKKIIQSPFFDRQKKKLHKQQIKDLDRAVKVIFSSPTIGDLKMGDLHGIRVYKFKSNNRQVMLAYEIDESNLFLYTFGSHENFYKKLKKYLQH